MTSAEMLAYLKSTMDEYGSIPAAFWVDPTDYYIALTAGQRDELADAAGGVSQNDRIFRNLVAKETLADGATLATSCYLPLSAYDATAELPYTIVDYGRFLAYHDIALPSFAQASVIGNVLKTTPSAQTILLRYIKNPDPIDATHNSPLDPVCHQRIVSRARVILLRKDVDSSLLDSIEPDRNKVKMFKSAQQKAKAGFSPKAVPYADK